jgi:SAM-dependent methyltransferase
VPQTYDRIGVGYANVRVPDPRLAEVIEHALGDAQTIVNVGAGAGSYEPAGRTVVAVEPSTVMLNQHPGRLRVQAGAERLPFPDHTFDAAMAVMTVHHWRDVRLGLAELKRVARRQVVFMWDVDWPTRLWIVDEYLPEIGVLERSRFPPLAQVERLLDAHTVTPFPIPWDFTDGYQPAYWRRPEAYLDPVIRAASSTFASLPDSVVVPAIERLDHDLRTGAWARRHHALTELDEVDYGYRLVVSG